MITWFTSFSSCSAPCFGFTLFLPTPQTNLIITHYDRYHLHIVNFIPAVLIFSHYRQLNLKLSKVTDIFTQHPIINFRQLLIINYRNDHQWCSIITNKFQQSWNKPLILIIICWNIPWLNIKGASSLTDVSTLLSPHRHPALLSTWARRRRTS